MSSLIRSVMFGDAGHYQMFGVSVSFRNTHYSQEAEEQLASSQEMKGLGVISKLASHCIQNKKLQALAMGNVHVLTHELSHALAAKLLTKFFVSVDIYPNDTSGTTNFPPAINDIQPWKRSVINAAGPLGDALFSSGQLMLAAAALKTPCLKPLGIALGVGAVMWLSGELLYAATSAINDDEGDFGSIRDEGPGHLLAASAALVGVTALGILGAIRIYKG